MPRSVECALHSQQLVGRARGRGAAVSGELIVTSVEIVAPIMIRALHAFRAKNPKATVRSGPQPDHPDNVVRLFFRLRTGLYAHHNYLEEHGRPASTEALAGHDFVGDEDADSPLPFFRWMKEHIPRQRATFRSANPRIRSKATVTGLGLVFIPEHEAKLYPDLVQVLDPRPD